MRRRQRTHLSQYRVTAKASISIFTAKIMREKRSSCHGLLIQKLINLSRASMLATRAVFSQASIFSIGHSPILQAFLLTVVRKTKTEQKSVSIKQLSSERQ